MKQLSIEGKSTIVVGEFLGNLANYCSLDRAIIITDNKVLSLYGEIFPEVEVITIGQGEGIKTLETVNTIYRRLLELEADRSYHIIGIGGGIVCDIAGFVAATYMRGLSCGFVATTLLAQVDASIGGKNGVNFMGYKNIVGTFRQPEYVLCDLVLLRTLPKDEIRNGLAEIIKYAAIADRNMFNFLESNVDLVLSLDEEAIEKLVYDSLVIKSQVVMADEMERGERRKLNFGHTLGHAIEKVTGLSHGSAVSIGIVAAAKISANRGLLPEEDVVRLHDLLKCYGLPTTLPEGNKSDIIRAMSKDKKRCGTSIHYVLLKNIGNALVEEIKLLELERVVDDLC